MILKDTRMYIEPHNSKEKGHGFEGFYIEYADNDRPKPLPLGMVSMIDSVPPTMNWIYVDKGTREVRYGNRSQSKEHVVGSWSWEAGEEGGAGGVTLEGEEGAVAVKTENGWQVFWEDAEGKVKVKGKGMVRVSLERKMLEPPKDDGVAKVTAREPQRETRVDTKTELTKNRFEDKAQISGDGQPTEMVKVTAGSGSKKKAKKSEPKLEISSSTVAKPMNKGS